MIRKGKTKCNKLSERVSWTLKVKMNFGWSSTVLRTFISRPISDSFFSCEMKQKISGRLAWLAICSLSSLFLSLFILISQRKCVLMSSKFYWLFTKRSFSIPLICITIYLIKSMIGFLDANENTRRKSMGKIHKNLAIIEVNIGNETVLSFLLDYGKLMWKIFFSLLLCEFFIQKFYWITSRLTCTCVWYVYVYT